MAGKRRATSELNHDNWNVSDDEEEGPGQFVPAETPALQNRTIIKAKRNFSQGSSTSGQGLSPFAQFAGFSSNAQNPFSSTTVKKQDTGSPFDKLFKKDTNTNGNSSDATEKQKETETQDKGDAAPSKEEQPRNVEYYRQLQSLNESVLNWMQLYYAKNACSDFTPVFADYKRHLDTLNINYQVKAKNASVSSTTSKTSSEGGDKKIQEASKEQVFTQGSSNSGDKTEYGAHFSSNTTNTSSFSYGMKLTPTSTSTGSPMGPNSSAKENNCTEKKETPQFSFGFGKSSVADSSFSFVPAPQGFAAEKSEEAYEPPKNDFKTVKEEDAFYSKRCKLFFKKDDNFVERGIGTLYLKKLEEKTQLLIRADTNLGNILLNIMLSSSLPMSRTGKNNVLVVSIPNPPLDAKKPDAKEAIPMLIRVKTTEDADELLEKLQAHKS